MIGVLLGSGLLSTAALALTLAVGWGISGGAGPTTHIQLSFMAMLGVLFSQVMTLFYLVGMGRRFQEVVRDESLSPSLLDGLPAGRSYLPLAILTLTLLMASFILGGGAHTGVLPPLVHGLLGAAALPFQGGSLLQEARALRRLARIRRKLERARG